MAEYRRGDRVVTVRPLVLTSTTILAGHPGTVVAFTKPTVAKVRVNFDDDRAASRIVTKSSIRAVQCLGKSE